jgi:hypothetical protein
MKSRILLEKASSKKVTKAKIAAEINTRIE